MEKRQIKKKIYRVMRRNGEGMELVGYYKRFPMVAGVVGVSSVTLRNWFSKHGGENYYRKEYEVSIFWLVEKEEWVNSLGVVLKRPKNKALEGVSGKRGAKNVSGERSIDYGAFNDTRYEE